MGRTAGGVTGIRLSKKDDYVVGTVIVKKGETGTTLLTVAEDGYGKKTNLSEYKSQNRGGSGMMTHKLTAKTGNLVTGKGIKKGSSPDILIATGTGKVLRLNSTQIPNLGRATQGVRLMKLDKGDKVSSVEIIEEELEIDVE
jgi:DNA gyrase subunit A